jgi:hypothetical protein
MKQLDLLNRANDRQDLVPRGRDEGELEHPMAWLRQSRLGRDRLIRPSSTSSFHPPPCGRFRSP